MIITPKLTMDVKMKVEIKNPEDAKLTLDFKVIEKSLNGEADDKAVVDHRVVIKDDLITCLLLAEFTKDKIKGLYN